MNLLKDPWIPIQQSGIQEKITLQQLLCGEREGELCLPRDDMEMACLQLLVAITQVLFMPENKKVLISRVKQPLSEDEYWRGCEDKYSWFELEHPDTPFMQYRGVASKRPESIALLMGGIRSGTNKVFVNPEGAGEYLCPSCVSVALFNTAVNGPNAGGGPGGGMKAGLRGSSPLSCMIWLSRLRPSIWANVLTAENTIKTIGNVKHDFPAYVDPICRGEKINASRIGINRGLLWMSTHFELSSPINGECSLCGQEGVVFDKYYREPFGFELDGKWRHPLSYILFSADGKSERYGKHSNRIPLWSHFPAVLGEASDNLSVIKPAVVSQAEEVFKQDRISIALGGYDSKQSEITGRFHKYYQVGSSWGSSTKEYKRVVDETFEYERILISYVRQFGKDIGQKNLSKSKNQDSAIYALTKESSWYFFSNVEPYVWEAFAKMSDKNPASVIDDLRRDLEITALSTFDEFCGAYSSNPKYFPKFAVKRRKLRNRLMLFRSTSRKEVVINE